MSFRPRTPQKLFTRVAPRYDFLNRLMSAGLDRVWRQETARELDLPRGGRVLDLATGTGALALAVDARGDGLAFIAGVDLNRRMLGIARRRVRTARHRTPVHLLQASGENLPFADGAFDGVTIGFAIDDMEGRERCAAEVLRVLAPGRRVALLELAMPSHPLLNRIYRLYLSTFPAIGKLFTRGAHEHLKEEILQYKGRRAVQELLQATGFVDYRTRDVTGGVVVVHSAARPLRK
mgnify:FL=1